MARKPDWSRPLAKPVKIGKKTLRTVSDVRAYLLGLPEERQRKAANQYIARLTIEAAQGGENDFTIPFMLAHALRN